MAFGRSSGLTIADYLFGRGRLVTLVGFALCLFTYERVLVSGFRFLILKNGDAAEFTPSIGRRAVVVGGLGLILAGGGAAMLRRLYRAATFSYDGTQDKGPTVQGITPNDQFYCVTKNVVDPRVNEAYLAAGSDRACPKPGGLSGLADIDGFKPVDQQTTLMCISNGLDAGLISNAIWKGVPFRELLDRASPLSGAARVRFHGGGQLHGHHSPGESDETHDPARLSK